jgi:hypothetical protein
MSNEFSHETFVTHNSNGSVSLDAWAGMSREELKARCSELLHAISNWQMIAMQLAEFGKDGLAPEDLTKVENLIEGYRD